MTCWRSIRFAECGQWLSGGTPSRSNRTYWTGAIPWVSAKSLKVSEIVDAEEHLSAEGVAAGSRLVDPGTLLFVTRGMSLANEFRVGVAMRPVAFNQDVKAVVPRPGIDSKYLLHFLRASQQQVLGLVDHASHGTARLTTERLAELPVPLPPLGEQRRIADILDRADALRAKRRAALDLLDELTHSIFVEMFGVAHAGWSRVLLAEVSDVAGGLQVTGARKQNPIEVPYLRVANVFRGRLDTREVKLMRVTPNELQRVSLRANDVLVVEGHGNPEEVGRAALWDGRVNPCVHQNHLIRVRADTTVVNPEFLCHWLNERTGRRHLSGAGRTTTGLNTISVSDVRAVPVFLPPIALQNEFTRRIRAVAGCVDAMQTSLAEMDALFASLQDRAFRGEL